MNTNWKTNLSGAFSALGKALIGVGVIPQLNGVNSKFLTYVAITGFFCDAISDFLGKLFAADATQVRNLSNTLDAVVQQQKSNTAQINKQ